MAECPYCLSLITDDDKVTKCQVCGAAYHAECFDENGGCAYRNCEKRIRPKSIEITVDAEPRTMLVLSRESVEKPSAALPARQHNPCLKCGNELPLGELYCPECDPAVSGDIQFKKILPMLVLIGVITLIVGWMAISLLAPMFGNTDEGKSPGPAAHEVTH